MSARFTPSAMLTRLDRLRRSGGAIGDYDWAFARFIEGVDPNEAVVLAAALVAAQTRDGHVCLDLAAIAGTSLFDDAMAAPELMSWRAALEESPAVGAPGAARPLVLDAASRLYLNRYWAYEHLLARTLRTRADTPKRAVDQAALSASVERWFTEAAPDDPQRLAAIAAVENDLTLIVGGPGTGKTTTVARILALLAAQPDAPGRVRLAAPTGKAAARLTAAIRAAHAKQSGGFSLPGEAQTIHRLLGALPQSTYFRHDAAHPIDTDCLIVDECSMLDLALAAKLVLAVPPGARLILMGDPDQLASVEAGAVLASLAAGGLHRSLVRLTRSHRFEGAGQIGRFAIAVRDGEHAAAIAVLNESNDVNVASHTQSNLRRIDPLRATVMAAARAGFTEFFAALDRGASAAELFAVLERFRVLAAERGGPLGARAINASIESALRARAGIGSRHAWYPGRVVIVTANDYGQRLFNGDMGVALVHSGTGELAVAIEGGPGDGAAGEVRWLSPARMPACETAFAMTIHKSQGSEFDRVLVVMPDAGSPLASRELLYTAVTRARSSLTLVANEAALEAAIKRRQLRNSGLGDALNGPALNSKP